MPSSSSPTVTRTRRCVAVPKDPVPLPNTDGICIWPEGLKFPPLTQFVQLRSVVTNAISAREPSGKPSCRIWIRSRFSSSKKSKKPRSGWRHRSQRASASLSAMPIKVSANAFRRLTVMALPPPSCTVVASDSRLAASSVSRPPPSSCDSE